MSQDLLYDFLARHPSRWFCIQDVVDATGFSRGSVCEGLKRMRRSGVVHYKKANVRCGVGRKEGARIMFVYKFKKCY